MVIKHFMRTMLRPPNNALPCLQELEQLQTDQLGLHSIYTTAQLANVQSHLVIGHQALWFIVGHHSALVSRTKDFTQFTCSGCRSAST